MSRQRPSGIGSNSRRFASVDDTKVPVAKDAATIVYVRAHDGSWPTKPTARLLYDASWITEGVTFEVEDLRPGRGMGSVRTFIAVEVRQRITVFDGKWGQSKRLVLAAEVLPASVFEEAIVEGVA